MGGSTPRHSQAAGPDGRKGGQESQRTVQCGRVIGVAVVGIIVEVAIIGSAVVGATGLPLYAVVGATGLPL